MDHGKKKVVITGGSGGIGRAIAASFLEEGAAVCIIGRSRVELDSAMVELGGGGEVCAVMADVSSSADMKRAAAEVRGLFGSVDVLITAAAVYGPIGRVTDIDPEEWIGAISVNLIGTFLAVRYLAPLMGEGGSIVTFVGGGEGPFPRFSSYVASKGGVARFTETVAAELAEKGVIMNAIAPGAVNTKLLEDLLRAGPERAGKLTYEQALKQKATGGISAERAAKLCRFLASEKAHGITGRIFSAIWDPYDQFPEHLKDIIGTDVYTWRRVRPEWLGFTWGDAPQE